MIDDSTWGFLLFDVLPDDGDWRSTARSGKVAGRPERAFPVPPFEFWEPSSQVPGRYSLEAVYEPGDCHLGRVMHQEMDMVFLPFKLYEIGLEVTAHVFEYAPHGRKDCLRENFSAVLGHEHEVDMQVENTMPSGADIACLCHSPMLS